MLFCSSPPKPPELRPLIVRTPRLLFSLFFPLPFSFPNSCVPNIRTRAFFFALRHRQSVARLQYKYPIRPLSFLSCDKPVVSCPRFRNRNRDLDWFLPTLVTWPPRVSNPPCFGSPSPPLTLDSRLSRGGKSNPLPASCGRHPLFPARFSPLPIYPPRSTLFPVQNV